MPTSTGWYWNTLPSFFFLPLVAGHWWLVRQVCHSHSLQWTVLEGWLLFLLKAGLPHYSCSAATLFSLTTEWCEALRRCTELCRVKFWKVESTVQDRVSHCSQMGCSSATPILRTKCTCTVVSCKPIVTYADNELACTFKIHVNRHLTVIWVKFIASTVTD